MILVDVRIEEVYWDAWNLCRIINVILLVYYKIYVNNVKK